MLGFYPLDKVPSYRVATYFQNWWNTSNIISTTKYKSVHYKFRSYFYIREYIKRLRALTLLSESTFASCSRSKVATVVSPPYFLDSKPQSQLVRLLDTDLPSLELAFPDLTPSCSLKPSTK